MLTKTLSFSFILVSALALTGCTDPMVGDWESDNDCGDSELTADDDGTGDGYVYMATMSNPCTKCDFDFDWEEKGDGDYDIEIEFDACNCGDVTKGDVECNMNDDEDEMDCELTLGTCPSDEAEWKKVE